jgi:hypothetical protein
MGTMTPEDRTALNERAQQLADSMRAAMPTAAEAAKAFHALMASPEAQAVCEFWKTLNEERKKRGNMTWDEKKNCLQDALTVMGQAGKSPADVLWVGSEDGTYAISWEQFVPMANFEYADGEKSVARDVVIVGDGWWLERWFVDEDWMSGWVYKENPTRKFNAAPFDAVRGGYDDTLASLQSHGDRAYEEPVFKTYTDAEWRPASSTEKSDSMKTGDVVEATCPNCDWDKARVQMRKPVLEETNVGEYKYYVVVGFRSALLCLGCMRIWESDESFPVLSSDHKSE